ncbi:MAG: putative aliphatic sulfonates transport permease protein SsuC [Firmicutes bacterium]|nr:putative aliphatic sulfonates transport permease protein SsuC [candidate division NPL-UPA2 bacterium]
MNVSIGSQIKPFYLVGGVCILLAWELVAVRTTGAVPRLRAVGESLLILAETGELWRQLAVSLHRSLTGLTIGAALGFISGAAAGFCKPVYYLLKPLIGTLLSSPAVVVVMLAMVWFGVGSSMAIFITALFTVPIMYVSVVEGMELIDADLLEMAAVYRLSRWNLWWSIYLPALATAILTGFAFAAGTAFRKTVMAELLGSNDGIGFAMAMTRFNLDAARLFAWVAVCLVVAGVLDFVLVSPVARYLQRWRTVSSDAGVVHE